MRNEAGDGGVCRGVGRSVVRRLRESTARARASLPARRGPVCKVLALPALGRRAEAEEHPRVTRLGKTRCQAGVEPAGGVVRIAPTYSWAGRQWARGVEAGRLERQHHFAPAIMALTFVSITPSPHSCRYCWYETWTSDTSAWPGRARRRTRRTMQSRTSTSASNARTSAATSARQPGPQRHSIHEVPAVLVDETLGPRRHAWVDAELEAGRSRASGHRRPTQHAHTVSAPDETRAEPERRGGVASAVPRGDQEPAHGAGRTFWFRRNRLWGSYSRLSRARRS